MLYGILAIGSGMMVLGLTCWDYYKQNKMWEASHMIGCVGGGMFIGAGLALLYYGYF